MHDLFGNEKKMFGNHQRHTTITMKANGGALMGFNSGVNSSKPAGLDERIHAQRQTPNKKMGGTHRASGPGGGDGSTSKNSENEDVQKLQDVSLKEFDIVMIRPIIEHDMLGVIMGRGGTEDLGVTLWGQTELSVYDDGVHGKWEMSYKYHERALWCSPRKTSSAPGTWRSTATTVGVTTNLWTGLMIRRTHSATARTAWTCHTMDPVSYV